MTATPGEDLSAEEALGVLSEIDGYEQALTAKTAGVSALVWGTAIPALFMTYNAGGHWVVDHGAPEWILALLWIPWIAGASLTTNWLWELNAVTLDVEAEGSGWQTSVAFTLLFFVVAGLVWGVLTGLGADFGINGWMVLATGAFTVALGAVYRWQGWVGATETTFSGLVILAGGLAIALAPASLAPDVAFGFASAALIGVAYYGAGIVLFLRG